MLALSPIDVPQAAAIRVDLRVLGFALSVSLLSGIAFGLLPAWLAGRPQIDRYCAQAASRTTGSVASTWMRRTLIAGEVALALMLTIGAFLLVKSLAGLSRRDPGFTVEQVMTAKLSLPEAKYGRGEALAQFQEQVEERLRALPGVHAAAIAHALPMQLGSDLPFTIEGKYVKGANTGVGDADIVRAARASSRRFGFR